MNWSGGSKNRLRIIRNDTFPVKNISMSVSGHLHKIPIVDKRSEIEDKKDQLGNEQLESVPQIVSNIAGVKIKPCIKNSGNHMGEDETPRVTIPTLSKQQIPFANIRNGDTGS